jgi:acyl carrier protein
MEIPQIQEVVLQAMGRINLTRRPKDRLEISANAPIFGPRSRLDSLGLVALLIEVEEALQDAGHDVTLSDARAMSQSQSPFRDVPSLVAFVASLMAEAR